MVDENDKKKDGDLDADFGYEDKEEEPKLQVDFYKDIEADKKEAEEDDQDLWSGFEIWVEVR